MVKKKDKKIINQLRDNARSNLTSISKTTGVPISTIHDRMKILDQYVVKHSALLNFASIGLIQANIFVKMNSEEKEKFSNFLKLHWNINSAYRIDNAFDFLIEGVFKEMKELHEFLDKVEDTFNIENKLVCHIISTIEKEKYKLD